MICLQNLFPINKRSIETFEKHFRSAGLGQIVDYQKSHQNSQVKKELQVELKNMIKQEDSVKEVGTKDKVILWNLIPQDDIPYQQNIQYSFCYFFL